MPAGAKKVSVLGSGEVGATLAGGFLKYGFAVMRGSRDPAKLADRKAQAGAAASTGTFAEAHRAALHALMHSRPARRRLDARVQAAEEVGASP